MEGDRTVYEYFTIYFSCLVPILCTVRCTSDELWSIEVINILVICTLDNCLHIPLPSYAYSQYPFRSVTGCWSSLKKMVFIRMSSSGAEVVLKTHQEVYVPHRQTKMMPFQMSNTSSYRTLHSRIQLIIPTVENSAPDRQKIRGTFCLNRFLSDLSSRWLGLPIKSSFMTFRSIFL